MRLRENEELESDRTIPARDTDGFARTRRLRTAPWQYSAETLLTLRHRLHRVYSFPNRIRPVPDAFRPRA
jgi:hypothetical protein